MNQQKNPCKGCVWQERISEEKIFCPFPHCVKGRLPCRAKEGVRK